MMDQPTGAHEPVAAKGRSALSRTMVTGVIALLFVLAVGMIGASFAWTPGHEAEAIAGLWFVLTLAFALASWLVIAGSLRAIGRGIASPHFGQTMVPQLVSGLMVTVLYPALPRQALTSLVQGVLQLGWTMPLSIWKIATVEAPRLQSEIAPESVKFDATSCSTRLLSCFLRQVEAEMTAFDARVVKAMPLTELFIGVALWVVFALAIRRLIEGRIATRAYGWLARQPSVNVPNAGFVLILAFGTFLSLAAIMSLPRLRQTYQPNSDVNATELTRVLTALRTQPTFLDAYPSADLKRNPLQEAVPTGEVDKPSGATVANADAGAGASGETVDLEPHEHWIRLQQETWRNSFDAVLSRATALAVEVKEAEAQNISAGVDAYRLKNLERHGSREEVEHFLAIRDWFSNRVQDNQRAVRACTDLIRVAQTALEDGATFIKEYRRSFVAARKANSLDMVLAAPEPNLEFLRYARSAACDLPPRGDVPAPPELGKSLGPLQFVAGWLLSAASLQLTMIVGMLGFGLLGAVLSTFIKERMEAKASPVESSPIIISDLDGVVLRGFSAAIVVFLAVQGGLGVLAGTTGDPNPYVLLLACFVAAVFSERVWARAYDYFADALARSGSKNEPPPPADPPQVSRTDDPSADEPSAGAPEADPPPVLEPDKPSA